MSRSIPGFGGSFAELCACVPLLFSGTGFPTPEGSVLCSLEGFSLQDQLPKKGALFPWPLEVCVQSKSVDGGSRTFSTIGPSTSIGVRVSGSGA